MDHVDNAVRGWLEILLVQRRTNKFRVEMRMLAEKKGVGAHPLEPSLYDLM